MRRPAAIARAEEKERGRIYACARNSAIRLRTLNLRASAIACCITNLNKGEIIMAEITVTSANFENEVLKSDKPVLIDFWAAWCGPCKMLSPVISEIAEEYEGRVKVCKVNVDEEAELANAFKVSSIPLVVVIKDGKVVNSVVGFRPKADIEALLN